MLLKNNKGIKREFEILIEVEKDDDIYIVYKDPITDSIYSGKKEDNDLKKLDDKEFEYIKNMIEKIGG